MSEQTYTPAPWKVTADVIDDEESSDYLCVESKDCDIASRILIAADARLIAAAPELLEALKNLCSDPSVNDGDVPCELYDAARAAIKRCEVGPQ